MRNLVEKAKVSSWNAEASYLQVNSEIVGTLYCEGEPCEDHCLVVKVKSLFTPRREMDGDSKENNFS